MNRMERGSAAREVRVTVLDGYYASGDYECFCFDRLDGPDEYHERWPDFEQVAERCAAHDANRVYPNGLLPKGARYGRWTITVEYEPLPAPEGRSICGEEVSRVD